MKRSVSVRPSVCPIIRPHQRRAAGLLLSAMRQEISIDSTAHSSKCGPLPTLAAELTRLNTDLYIIPEVVLAAEDEPRSRVTRGDGVVKRRLADGAPQTADVPVPLHGVQQEPVDDRPPAPAARRPGRPSTTGGRRAVGVPLLAASTVRHVRIRLAHRRPYVLRQQLTNCPT